MSTQNVCHGEAVQSRTRCVTRIDSTANESDGTIDQRPCVQSACNINLSLVPAQNITCVSACGYSSLNVVLCLRSRRLPWGGDGPLMAPLEPMHSKFGASVHMCRASTRQCDCQMVVT